MHRVGCAEGVLSWGATRVCPAQRGGNVVCALRVVLSAFPVLPELPVLPPVLPTHPHSLTSRARQMHSWDSFDRHFLVTIRIYSEYASLPPKPVHLPSTSTPLLFGMLACTFGIKKTSGILQIQNLWHGNLDSAEAMDSQLKFQGI